MKTGKYTLVYSAEASKGDQPNKARTNDGIIVDYTFMVDEREHGRWRKSYLWEDAEIVGYVDDVGQITYIA